MKRFFSKVLALLLLSSITFSAINAFAKTDKTSAQTVSTSDVISEVYLSSES